MSGKLTVGSLFAGIGGFDLGLERAGFEIKWQVEIDPFCRAVLAKHWPQVKRYDDVRTVGAELERVDVICGGFPCQDISLAGRGAGLAGERSGLWSEYLRVIRELRPRYVLVENVAALLARGMGTVLGDLAKIGYDAEWICVPASAFGAVHKRDRTWIVSYANGDHDSERPDTRRPIFQWSRWAEPSGIPWWETVPGVGRVVDGIPDQVDRLKGLGNAIVPQIAEWIGRRILEAEEMNQSGSPQGRSR
jgi:DNA (cytosine-5)-methyltransferase 1